MSVLIDSNILIDALQPDDRFHSASARTLARLSADHRFVVNEAVYAELAPQAGSIENLDQALAMLTIVKEAVPWPAAFLAGMAHARYRRAGGSRDRVLPDFLIGAHASVAGHRLLTRDPERYRSYFPDLDLITPETPS